MQDVMYFSNYRAMMDRCLTPITRDIAEKLGRAPKDVLNSSDRMPFYGFFKSRDGKVAIVALTARQWKDLTEIIGRPEMASDPRFGNIIVQIRNHGEAVSLIEEWTARHKSEEIITLLEERKIPCGIAYTSDQVNTDPNLELRDMFRTVDHAEFGPVDVPGFPFKFSEAEGSLRMAAPGLGEHTKLILGEWLGYSDDEVKALYEARVVL